MIDIHSHIIPGIDDGSRSTEQSKEMLYTSLRSGVKYIVATPHFNRLDYSRINRVIEKVEELNRYVNEVRVLTGSEVFVNTDTLPLIKDRKLLSLNKSNNYLVEYGFHGESWWIECTISDMLKSGIVPVIAHPERYRCVQENYSLVKEWLDMGAFVQLNKGSLEGIHGRTCKTTAISLLNEGYCSCIASDAHDLEIRNTDLKDVYNYLSETYSKVCADNLLYNNPARLLGIS